MGPVGVGRGCFNRSANDLTLPVIAGLSVKQETGSVKSMRLLATPEVDQRLCFGSGARVDLVGKKGVVRGPEGNDAPDCLSAAVDASMALRRSSIGGSTIFPVPALLIQRGLADLLDLGGKTSVLCFRGRDVVIGTLGGIFPFGASLGTGLGSDFLEAASFSVGSDRRCLFRSSNNSSIWRFSPVIRLLILRMVRSIIRLRCACCIRRGSLFDEVG